MNIQKICICAIALILSASIFVQAQEEPYEYQLPEISTKAILVDEFGETSGCDLNGRISNVFISVNTNPSAKIYWIVYRGNRAVFSNQSESYLQRNFRRIKNEVGMLGLDESRMVLIDGGFRESDSIVNEVWVAHENGEAPAPTKTVEKPKTPQDIAYKVDVREFDDAWGADFENTEKVILSEGENDFSNSDSEMPEVQAEDYYEKPNWISDFFFSGLSESESPKGVIIVYADLSEYDLGKIYQSIDKDLKKYAEQSKLKTNGAKIVFGGYRKNVEIEYWFVPESAKEPLPTPEVRKIKESENVK